MAITINIEDFPLYLMGTILNADSGIKDVELYGDWVIPITKDLNLVERINLRKK